MTRKFCNPVKADLKCGGQSTLMQGIYTQMFKKKCDSQVHLLGNTLCSLLHLCWFTLVAKQDTKRNRLLCTWDLAVLFHWCRCRLGFLNNTSHQRHGNWWNVSCTKILGKDRACPSACVCLHPMHVNRNMLKNYEWSTFVVGIQLTWTSMSKWRYMDLSLTPFFLSWRQQKARNELLIIFFPNIGWVFFFNSQSVLQEEIWCWFCFNQISVTQMWSWQKNCHHWFVYWVVFFYFHENFPFLQKMLGLSLKNMKTGTFLVFILCSEIINHSVKMGKHL